MEHRDPSNILVLHQIHNGRQKGQLHFIFGYFYHTGPYRNTRYKYLPKAHTQRTLSKFQIQIPLEHKSAVVNALTHRANSLIGDENNKRMELKYIQNVLTLIGYPNWLLDWKLKIKSDPLLATPTTRNAVETRGIAILPYVPKLSD